MGRMEDVMILTVKEFNRRQTEKYNQAVKDWKPEQGGFPYYPMYVFKTPEGNNRVRGHVVSNGNSHQFYLHRADVEFGQRRIEKIVA